MVSANVRHLLVGMAAISANLGWLQLAPAFGFPVAAPAAMLDRMLGPSREAGPAGWAMLLIGQAAFAALSFVVVERRTRGALTSLAFAVGAWLICGAFLMPLIGLVQGAPAPNTPAAMQANFFMLGLGPAAAAEALVGWLLFGAVIAAGSLLRLSVRTFALAIGAAALAVAVALAAPALGAQAGSGRPLGGAIVLPAAPVFFSVMELPQPAGAVLAHQHGPGFVVDSSGVATVVIGGGIVGVGPGDAFFIANQQPHSHENRAAVPSAIAVALVVVGLAVGLAFLRGRGPAVALMAALLVVATLATVNPLMNHWYFVTIRPAAMHGFQMPVPAAHRTYEGEDLTGLASGPYVLQLTDHRLGSGESLRVVGPAAIVVLDGQASIVADGRTTALSAQSGATIAGGTETTVQSGSRSPRVLVIQLLPAG